MDIDMASWGRTLALVLSLVGAQLELDCARPEAARDLIGRVMLADIEGAEDIHRAAMWDAFGRCAAGPAREPCVTEAKRRFEADWERQKAAIEAKYRKMLEDFQQRCRASLTLAQPCGTMPGLPLIEAAPAPPTPNGGKQHGLPARGSPHQAARRPPAHHR